MSRGFDMRPSSLESERRKLYARTIQHMEKELRPENDFHAMLATLAWGMKEIDRTYEQTAVKIKSTVACREHCAHCCSVPVDVQAHEVFFAAEFIQLNFSSTELAGAIARTAAHRVRATGLNNEQRDQLRDPCGLLRDGSCSIYAGRPEACRAHHSNNASTCAAHSINARVDVAKVYIPELRSRLFAVMLGMDEAIETAGFDDRSYDFGSALHEALTNSLCQVLWMRKKPAFPDSCLADLV